MILQAKRLKSVCLKQQLEVLNFHSNNIMEFETSIISDNEYRGFLERINNTLSRLIVKHANELRSRNDNTMKYDSDYHLLVDAYEFNAYEVLCYYNENLSTIRFVHRDEIAGLLYTAEDNLCIGGGVKAQLIMNKLNGVPTSIPKYDYCHWIQELDHDSFLHNLKFDKTAENGITTLIETKRKHAEAKISKAYKLINSVRDFYVQDYDKEGLIEHLGSEFLDKAYEEKHIHTVIDIYKLNESKEESVMLELAILKSCKNNIEKIIDTLINNKNLEKVSEKIHMINKIYDFISSVILSLKQMSSREVNRVNIINFFDKNLN